MKNIFIVMALIVCLATTAQAVEEGQIITVDSRMDISGDTYQGNKYINSEAWSNGFPYPGNTKANHSSGPSEDRYGKTSRESLATIFPVLRRDEAERGVKGAKFDDIKDLGIFGLNKPNKERKTSDMMIIALEKNPGLKFISSGLGTTLTARNIDETFQALCRIAINGMNHYNDTLMVYVDGVDRFQSSKQFNAGIGGARTNPLYDLAAFLVGLSAQTGTGTTRYAQPPFIKAYTGRMVPEKMINKVWKFYLEYYLSLDRQGQSAFFDKAPIDINSAEQLAAFPVLEDRLNNFFVDNLVTKEMYKGRYNLSAPGPIVEETKPGVNDNQPPQTAKNAQKSFTVLSILPVRVKHIYKLADLEPGQEIETQAFYRLGQEYAQQKFYKDGIHLFIDGHCDERGTPGYNASLGRERAILVKTAYVLKGFYDGGGTEDQARTYVHAVSSGEDNPQTADEKNQANYQNERVTIAWLGKLN